MAHMPAAASGPAKVTKEKHHQRSLCECRSKSKRTEFISIHCLMILFLNLFQAYCFLMPLFIRPKMGHYL